MTGNYSNTLQEYMSNVVKRSSNLEIESKLKDSNSFDDEYDESYLKESQKSSKNFKPTYKRNVYSMGWHLITQPKAIPFISEIDNN